MIANQNIWRLAAAWWFLMGTFAATLTLPVLRWDEIWAAYRYLIAQALFIFVIGFLAKAPARYATRMVLIGVLFMLPAALSCFAPALIVAFVLDPQPAPARAFFIIVSSTCLLIWRIVRISGREDKWLREPIVSYLSIHQGIAYFVGPSADEGQQHKLLQYIAWLGMLYPALILLVWIYYYIDAEPAYTLATMPLAWMGIGIIAWSASHFVHWILRIWRYEQANGLFVYLENPVTHK